MSNYKRIQNEINIIDTIRKINTVENRIWIVHVIIDDECSKHNAVVKMLLLCNYKPIAIYSVTNNFYLIYETCTITPVFESIARGNEIDLTYDNLATFFSSVIIATIRANTSVNITKENLTVYVNIVELQTKVNLIAYLSWKIFDASRNAIISTITDLKPEDKHLPWDEIMALVEKSSDAEKWKNLKPHLKFGMISKWDPVAKVIKTKQESIDFKNSQKYISFIFG